MVGRLLQNSRSGHICVQQKYLYSTTAFLFNFKEQTKFIQQILFNIQSTKTHYSFKRNIFIQEFECPSPRFHLYR